MLCSWRKVLHLSEFTEKMQAMCVLALKAAEDLEVHVSSWMLQATHPRRDTPGDQGGHFGNRNFTDALRVLE